MGFSVDGVPLFQQLGLVLGQPGSVAGDPVDGVVGGQVGDVIDSLGVGEAQGFQAGRQGFLAFGAHQEVDHGLGGFGMRAAFDHRAAHGGGGSAVFRVLQADAVRAGLEQGVRAVLIGQAHGVLAGVDGLEADGGRGRQGTRRQLFPHPGA